MHEHRYVKTLRTPGVKALLGICLLARIPITAAPVVLTLHVVLSLHRGFTDSGIVAAAIAIGTGVGSPVVGRALDRLPLRHILVVTTTAACLFWSIAARLPFLGLLITAFVSGLLAMPVFMIARQSLSASLPPEQQLAGMSLDAMSVEVSYAIGPAAGVFALTQAGSGFTFAAIAVALASAGVALFVLDPPMRTGSRRGAADPAAPSSAAPAPRRWVSTPLVATLIATSGATLTLAGTDTAITAAMRSFGQIDLLGLVVLAWCLSSLLGGFVYGMRPAGTAPWLLLVGISVLTIPVGLVGSWWLLALLIIPSGALNAPMISSSAHLVSTLSPTAQRGRALGMHTSALTFGDAMGAPIAGALVDHTGIASSFAGLGMCGLALAAGSMILLRHPRRHEAPDPVATTPAG